MKPLSVYDWKTHKRLAFLQNAYEITYTQQTNAVWTASFSLPYSDEKKIYCAPLNFIEIWDIDAGGDDKYVGLFRILPITEENDKTSPKITYELEHMFGTLLDSVVLNKLTFSEDMGNNELSWVIYVLSTAQNGWMTPNTNIMWDLLVSSDYYGVKYSYEFKEINLLSAIFQAVAPLIDYYWKFNTERFPWRATVKKISDTPVADIRYGKNVLGIKKKVDPRTLCTRLIPLGKRTEEKIEDSEEVIETVVTIESVNGGKKYLDSAEGIENYGVITQIINDEQFETPESLYDYATALLSKIDKPFVTYEIDIQAIYGAANLNIGDVVRIVTEDGLDENLVVQEITKDDVSGAPNQGKIIVGQGTVEMGVIIKSFI